MKFKYIIALLILISTKALSGNVTIIAHGYSSEAINQNGWVWNMAFKMGEYERRAFEYGKNSNKTFYQVVFTNNIIQTKLAYGVPLKNNPSGDIIIALDWEKYSGSIGGSLFGGTIASTIDVSKELVVLLMKDGAFEGLNGPITQFPIHLVGHSRGGSLVCELGKRLGEYGIYVHQITTLDPHPLQNDGLNSTFEGLSTAFIQDGTVRYGMGKNILFADNYYQKNNILKPNGTIVEGAFNRNLSKEFTFPLQQGDDEHTLVHAWYYSTLFDQFPYISDGSIHLNANERSNWFSKDENLGRNAGYIYSFRAGQRLDTNSIAGYEKDFLNNLKYGLGDKFDNFRDKSTTRPWGNKAKNILFLDWENQSTEKVKKFEFGEPIDYIVTTRISTNNLKFKLVYQADYPNTTPYEPVPVYFFVDSYENIHYGTNRLDGNDSIWFENVTVPSTGQWNVNNVTFDYSKLVANLKPGFYKFGAIIGGGMDSRHYYSTCRLFVEPDAKVDIKYVKEQNVFGFTLFGTVGRQFVFERSFDLIKWEQAYSGTFIEYESGNYSGKNFTTGTGIGPMTYWRLRYN